MERPFVPWGMEVLLLITFVFRTLTGRNAPAGGKPMWTAKWILDAYEAGDQSVRGEMYMIYRDLRCYFDEIEVRSEGLRKQKAGWGAEKTAGARWNTRSRLVKGFGA